MHIRSPIALFLFQKICIYFFFSLFIQFLIILFIYFIGALRRTQKYYQHVRYATLIFPGRIL